MYSERGGYEYRSPKKRTEGCVERAPRRLPTALQEEKCVKSDFDGSRFWNIGCRTLISIDSNDTPFVS